MRRTCRRINSRSGLVETETTYGITSLPRALAGPQQLEQFWRGHWTIENRLHYVRDETLGEDRCQVHTGQAPQALAAFRNAILSLLRFHGWSNIAAATRRYADKQPSVSCDSWEFLHYEITLHRTGASTVWRSPSRSERA